MQGQVYYKHEGIFNPLGIIPAFLFGAVAAAVLGFIYSFLIIKIPFVYINMFICMGYSLAIGYAVAVGAKKGRIRNANLVFILALLVGLLAEYIQWQAWIFVQNDYELWLMSPSELINCLSVILEIGSWSIKGNVVNGIPLLIVWVIEGGIIVLFGAFEARSIIEETPYCERCQEWVEGKIKLPYIQIAVPLGVIKNQLENGDFNSLLTAPRSNPDDIRYLEVTLSRCSSCTTSNYLNLNFVEKVKNKNKVNEKKTPVVKNLIISYDTYNSFINPQYNVEGQQY